MLKKIISILNLIIIVKAIVVVQWTCDDACSYERLKVGTEGSGKELLQPLLDWLFSTSIANNSNAVTSKSSSSSSWITMKMQRDKNESGASDKIKGSLNLSYVYCDNAEEAIGLLFCGHRSIDERKSSVGDDIIICILQKDDDNVYCCNVNDDGHNISL